MKRLLFLLCVLSSAIASSSFASAAATKLKLAREFTAQIIVKQENTPVRTGTLYFSHGLVRTEVLNPGAPHPLITIVRLKEKRIFVLMPENHAFALEPWTTHEGALALALERGEKAIPSGNETVGGDDCEKYLLESKKDPAVRSIEIWISKTTRLPAQLQVGEPGSPGAEQIMFLNARAEKQPATLFDPPPKYREIGSASRPGG